MALAGEGHRFGHMGDDAKCQVLWESRKRHFILVHELVRGTTTWVLRRTKRVAPATVS